jgi:cell division protein FtsB
MSVSAVNHAPRDLSRVDRDEPVEPKTTQNPQQRKLSRPEYYRDDFQQPALPKRNQFGSFARPPAADGGKTMEEKIDASVSAVKQDAQQMQQLQQRATASFRSIDTLSRGSEFIVGTVAASGTLGLVAAGGMESFLRQDPAALSGALQKAQTAGKYIMGELTAETNRANGLFHQFSGQYGRYKELNAALQNAIRAQDHGKIASLSQEMDALKPEMQKTVEQLERAAHRIAGLQREFDSVAKHAAAHAAFSAVGAGVGALHPAAGIAENVLHIMKDSALFNAGSRAVEH